MLLLAGTVCILISISGEGEGKQIAPRSGKANSLQQIWRKSLYKRDSFELKIPFALLEETKVVSPEGRVMGALSVIRRLMGPECSGH